VNKRQKTQEPGVYHRASQEDLLRLEAKYCSWGDTVHYVENPNIFKSCRGSFLYDVDGIEYLDLQMLYSAVSFHS